MHEIIGKEKWLQYIEIIFPNTQACYILTLNVSNFATIVYHDHNLITPNISKRRKYYKKIRNSILVWKEKFDSIKMYMHIG